MHLFEPAPSKKGQRPPVLAPKLPPEPLGEARSLRLLTPKQIQEQNKKREATTKTTLTDLERAIADKRRELGEVEAQFNATLQRQQKKWTSDLAKTNAHIDELRKIVETLEFRREQALIPLDTRAKELDTIASALSMREQEIEQKEEAAEEKLALLEGRLDEVSEREQHAQELGQVLAFQEQEVTRLRGQMKVESDRLTKSIAEAQQNIAGESAKLAKRIAEVEALEKALMAKEAAFKEREQRVEALEVLYANYPFTSPIKNGNKQ